MTSKIYYKGKLRTSAEHLYSGSIVETDAPLDNHGLAQRFSPTDLVATALGSCMLSIMGITANTHNISIENSYVEIEKIMASEPRRIAEVKVKIVMPALGFSDKEKSILENSARNCPVAKSLSEKLVQDVTFEWLNA